MSLLLNGTFTNADEWNLINGSTATGGTLTVVANGNVAADFPNWSAQYPNILPQSLWETRRYRLTFDARQTVGSGGMQIAQRFSVITTQALTGSFVQYIIEFNGDGGPAGNDLVFGGNTSGDTFEIQNMVLEDIGASTADGAAGPGSPAQVVFYTNFETDQWGANGVPEPAGNFWEVDHGLPRTTDHIDAAISTGRDGTGRAVWLGSYNSDPTRNELGKDNLFSWHEHWTGFSIYIDQPMGNSRIWMQDRNLTDGGSNSVNAISLRESATQLYFSLCTDVTRVDQTSASLGGWSGAGTGTTSVFFDYNTGEWIDIVIHYKGAFGAAYTGPDTSALTRTLGYDPRSDGYIEIWVNGVQIVDHVGTTVYRYERDGANSIGVITPKIGPYWSDVTPTGNGFQGYYDNYKVWVGPGGTYEDVNPSPLPQIIPDLKQAQAIKKSRSRLGTTRKNIYLGGNKVKG